MIELRTTERGTFKACNKRWEWAVKEGLAKERTATPLWFGTAVHMALADWYLPGLQRGPHPARTFEKVLEGDRTVFMPPENEEQMAEFVDARALGIEMLEHYVDHYGKDPDKFYIATERTGHIYLPKLGMRRGRDIKYYFTFDGVYRDLRTGLIWLDEHKTAAGINTDQLTLNEQASSYWAVAERTLKKEGLIKGTDKIAGIMFNFLRKKERDRRPVDEDGLHRNKPQKKDFIEAFQNSDVPESAWKRAKMEELIELARIAGIRVLGEKSKMQPLPFFVRHPVYRSPEERNNQLREIQKDAWHIERAHNDPTYPITKRPSRDCSWCDFKIICQLDSQGDQDAVEDFKETMYIKRDPFEAYRKSAE